MLEAKNIKKTYHSIKVLKGIDISIGAGELFMLLGASGAGKTTFLHILGTLDTPTEGIVSIDGQRIDNLSSNALAHFRNQHIGFVFQFHHLLPEFTALENVCIPGYIAKRNEKEVQDYALEIMEILGVAHRKSHKPSALSGGEQQRIAIARALINSPKIVFADEPTGNLDSENTAALYQLFIEIKERMNTTFVVATHNQDLAKNSDRMAIIKDGLIEHL